MTTSAFHPPDQLCMLCGKEFGEHGGQTKLCPLTPLAGGKGVMPPPGSTFLPSPPPPPGSIFPLGGGGSSGWTIADLEALKNKWWETHPHQVFVTTLQQPAESGLLMKTESEGQTVTEAQAQASVNDWWDDDDDEDGADEDADEEEDAMPTTSPLAWQWFSLDEQMDFPEDLLDAYELPDYSGPRTGTGLFVDLYGDPELSDPVGRLWTNGTATGLVHVPDEDPTLYTIAALRLRQLRVQGKTAQEAFGELAGDYDAGPVFQGPLEDIADPALEDNQGL